MNCVNKLLTVAASFAILGIIFGSLLITDQVSIDNEEKKGKSDFSKLSSCENYRLTYIILLGVSVATSATFGVWACILDCREKSNKACQTSEPIYHPLPSPDEEETDVDELFRRTGIDDSQAYLTAYSVFPPAAMYAY